MVPGQGEQFKFSLVYTRNLVLCKIRVLDPDTRSGYPIRAGYIIIVPGFRLGCTTVRAC